MSNYETVTHERLVNNIKRVFERLTTMVEKDQDDAEAIATQLDMMLDDLHANDVFGTEGQRDPRGDMRNGTKPWSVRTRME